MEDEDAQGFDDMQNLDYGDEQENNDFQYSNNYSNNFNYYSQAPQNPNPMPMVHQNTAQQNRFAQFLIHALDTVQQYGPEYLILISHFFESNGIMTILENICKDEVYCSIKKDLNLI